VTRNKRILRTGLSSLIGTGADLVAMVLLVEVLGVAVGLAAFLGAGVGAATGFVLSKFYAFKDPRPVDPRQVAMFALVALANASFVATAVHVLSVGFGVPYLLGKVLAASISFICVSYPAQSRLVFRPLRPLRPTLRPDPALSGSFSSGR
jgi:putative flippase GtrA